MRRQISTILAATALALPLLAGCGGGDSATAPPGASSAPASSAPPSASSTPSAPATSDPAAEKRAVQEASSTFVRTVLTVTFADGPDAAYQERVKTLTTDRGYSEVSSIIPGKEDLTSLRARFGETARSNPQLLGKAVVTSFEGERATATQKFRPRVEQRKDGKWRTVKAAVVDEDATLTLVKEDGRWLVDRLS